ncbi:DUF2169 domain-containing protein [Mesorhizobium sp.]|uniref:DUF2169 family type VI secretion system accessory protein n=1 Tax=Mesorhizobium sp. TaxID=1871066 RepID=UPI000FE3CEDF|nr:DUF2169 domain-containing protein [Mesorhizobium sp.]RWH68327.1 MAG: DUF2169 domain-containing protein [Mesorhizobium sp.]RWL25095.1 MAG: DUF2169 domain-containing protein [Mesorhizobium sp.]RWL27600.1 MAG: DUF2169 domain-containing protein [Mesorhizobium sp.]RWL36316.1 MAG: DUF2169 domain-containing protein [Mesorhizobium sp.]RWL53601.1 MAG: DUF2169 domain-containing protein [Mesorhizobium sp.]
MFPLSNHTPFAAEGLWTRDESGQEVWLVAIKASFQINPTGEQTPLQKQIPVNMAPIFSADGSELVDDDDFQIEKKHTDVLVEGHVHAPGGQSNVETLARIKIGELDKTVKVTGNRSFVPGPVSVRMTSPEPFIRLPISWRRTYGGAEMEGASPDWDQRNPVGTGFAVSPQRLIGKAAPNFEYQDAPYRDHRSGRPAGFGPVAPHWLPRARYAGTYGKEWEKTRNPLLPRDFNRLHYQCAPEDQQTKSPLIGYEDVRLGGFTADGFMQFLLPRITFDITSHFKDLPDVKHGGATIHTLRIRPDDRQFSITWLSALPVPFDEEKLSTTTIRIRRRTGVSPSISRTGVWLGPS